MRDPRSSTTRSSTRKGSSGSTTSCSPTRFSSTPTPSSAGCSRRRSSSARWARRSSITGSGGTSPGGRKSSGSARGASSRRHTDAGAPRARPPPASTPAPGDPSIGMTVAAMRLFGKGTKIDVSADVNETAGIVYAAKKGKGKSAVLIFGGGSPKNFMLQTEPQLQEVLGIAEKGHDYFLQVTDARPDTGGLSGATPSEAVSWGKVNPDRLAHAAVCYLDSTVAMPLLTAHTLARVKRRAVKQLHDRRAELLAALGSEFRPKQHARKNRGERRAP